MTNQREQIVEEAQAARPQGEVLAAVEPADPQGGAEAAEPARPQGEAQLADLHAEEQTASGMRDLSRMLLNVGILLVLVWLVFTFFLGVKMAPNDDMSPRMSAGDILLYYRIDKQPAAQDVIVLTKNGTEYVGRVVAVGGDTVDITNESALIINDNMVIEDKIFYPTPRYEGFVDYPLVLAPEEYFVLVDQREGGEDSRYYGPVSADEIQGTVIGQFRRTGI